MIVILWQHYWILCRLEVERFRCDQFKGTMGWGSKSGCFINSAKAKAILLWAVDLGMGSTQSGFISLSKFSSSINNAICKVPGVDAIIKFLLFFSSNSNCQAQTSRT